MDKKLLTRRAFLRLAALATIGAGAAIIHRATSPVGPVTYMRWLLRGQIRQLTGAPAIVALDECPAYDQDILRCLRGLWGQADMPDVRGKRVLVKPNMIDLVEGHPTTTAPEVVGAVIDLLAESGAGEIIVGEGPGFRRDAWSIVQGIGLAQVLDARGVPFVDLNYDDPAPVPVKDGWLRRSPELWLPRRVREADLIVSVPKLKTHHWAGVTLSVKNLFGVVPGVRYGWPKNMLHVNGFWPSIAGVYLSVPPVVAVVDGIVGMEGDGPLFGAPVQHGMLAVGRDPVAVDVVCTQLMGFSVQEVHLALLEWAGVGQSTRIEMRGVAREHFQRQYQHPPVAS